MAQEITAIVPTFNRAAMIGEALEAIMAQKRAVSEIIVWDDGSKDDTPAKMAEITARHPDLVRYERAENGGKSRALNKALELARGEYIWICDDDDIALPDATLRLAEPLDADPDLGLVAGKHLRFSTPNDLPGPVETRKMDDAGYWPDLERGSILRHTLEDIFFFQNGTLVRRTCYDQVGPFATDLARSIDYEMTVRLLARYPAKVLDDPVFLQRKHDGARGPSWALAEAKRSEEVWSQTDREIFRRLRPMLPLSLYQGMFEGDTPLVARAARLQRGAVYARRGDWNLALVDFEEAARTASTIPLTADEGQILVRAMAGKHGVADIFGVRQRRRVMSLHRSSVAGQGIARALSKGAIWRLRAAAQERRFADAIDIALFILRMPPFMRPSKTDGTEPALVERQHLPLESYAW